MNNLRRRMMMGLASLPPKEETTEIVAPTKGFFERNVANGNQFTYPIIRGGVKEIRGNTLAWNQLVTNNGARVSGGQNICYYDSTKGGYVITDRTVGDSAFVLYITDNDNFLKECFLPTHAYYVRYHNLSGSVSESSKIAESSNGNTIINNLNENGSAIVGKVSSPTTWYPLMNFPAGSTISNFSFTLNVIDLTLMFGDGNEPTIEEFEAMFPLDYYAQDDGRLINFNGEELVSKGINNNTIGRIILNPATWTGKLNGEGESVTVFPDGMRGAGEAYDSIEKVDGQWWGVVNVGSVDLGTLNWGTFNSTSTNTIRCYTTFSDKKLNNTYVSYIIAPMSNGTPDYFWNIDEEGLCEMKNPSRSGIIVRLLKTKAQATKASFQEALSGIILNYAKVTPQRYLLDPIYQAYLNALYQVEQGGMEYILPSNTSTPYTSPAKIDVKYNSISDRKRSGLPNVVQ